MAGYGSNEGLEDWLTARGRTLPDGANSDVLRQLGSDYVDATYADVWPGRPTGGVEQERAWPRTGAAANWQTIGSDVIPLAIVNASYAAAWLESQRAGALAASARGSGVVTREKIDVLEREYAEGSGNAIKDATTRFSEVEGLVKPYILPETVVPLGVLSVGGC
ncbi:MAG: DnaT-like ssDNA-binding protein [Brevundimonas sp.]